VAGLSLHANVDVPAGDRARLERLCRYAARPPVATERLDRLDDGRLIYRLRHRWRDGTTHVIFEPLDLLAKLAALVPPPRFHMVRFHGVLASAARRRSLVVPKRPEGPGTARARAENGRHEGCRSPRKSPTSPEASTSARSDESEGHRDGSRSSTDEIRSDGKCGPTAPLANSARGDAAHGTEAKEARRYAWAELMRRVFQVDVLECPRCGGPSRILAAIHPPDTTAAILECLKMSTRPPPITPPDPGARTGFQDPDG
jgi:hypothetical protein